MINHFRLSSLAVKGELDSDLKKKLEKEDAYRISLSKRKEIGKNEG